MEAAHGRFEGKAEMKKAEHRVERTLLRWRSGGSLTLSVGVLSPMSQSPPNDYQAGNRCLVQKDYEKAIELFLRHAETHPQERAASYVQVAECYLRSNIVTQPVPISTVFTLVSAGDMRSAEYYYRLALETDPNHFGALRGLAGVLPEGADERLSVLERAAALQPNFLILLALGDFYRSHRKDLSRAYETYRHAQEQSPRDQDVYRRLNDICRRLDRPDEAAEWSERWRQAKTTRRRVDGKTV